MNLVFFILTLAVMWYLYQTNKGYLRKCWNYTAQGISIFMMWCWYKGKCLFTNKEDL